MPGSLSLEEMEEVVGILYNLDGSEKVTLELCYSRSESSFQQKDGDGREGRDPFQRVGRRCWWRNLRGGLHQVKTLSPRQRLFIALPEAGKTFNLPPLPRGCLDDEELMRLLSKE